MSLTNYRKRDFFIVLSLVNTKLRDEYSSLEDLASAQDLDIEDLKKFFEEHNYEYSEQTKSFKEK